MILLLLLLFLAPARADEIWSLHAQITTVTQGDEPFRSPYSGPNSLAGEGENDTSLTTTLFAGRKLWSGGEIYFNPEVTAGRGLSATHGVAGFPNGEIYRVDTVGPVLNPARMILRQTVGFGGPTEIIAPDQNQLGRTQDIHRLTLEVGKFSLVDDFDNNRFSDDPRNQFLNWGCMADLAWDYAADTRGYTWGFILEYNAAWGAIRWAEALMPEVANGPDFDLDIAQAHGDNLEGEVRYELGGRPGKVRILGYINHAHMGSYGLTLSNPVYDDDVTRSRAYRIKWGGALNFEQEIGADVGLFSRLGWNDGATESFVFAEVDRTLSLGISSRGNSWSRPRDLVGAAILVNWISKSHADYLSSGGSGFMLGDGALTYAPEEILEFFYLWNVISRFDVTADFQYVNDPGYNAARGPAAIEALRLHYEL